MDILMVFGRSTEQNTDLNMALDSSTDQNTYVNMVWITDINMALAAARTTGTNMAPW